MRTLGLKVSVVAVYEMYGGSYCRSNVCGAAVANVFDASLSAPHRSFLLYHTHIA